MARVWDEKFEGTGTEETWSGGEVIEGASTIDDDADPADVSNPSSWGTQCMKCVSAGTTDEKAYLEHAPTWTGSMHFRVEFVLTAESFADTNASIFLYVFTAGFTADVFLASVYQASGGALKIRVGQNDAGAGKNFNISSTTLSLGTRYRFEMQWDIPNNLWEWKIDGVSEYNGTLTSTHPTDIGVIRLGLGAGSADIACTIYHDLFAVDDAKWVGPEGGAAYYYAAQG